MELEVISSSRSTGKNVQHIENQTSASRAIRPQILIASACFLVGISVGMSLGHSAVLLPELQSTNSSLFIDEDTGSWIASVYAVSGPVGSLTGGIAMDWWGRRKISFAGNSGMVIGWLLICSAQSVTLLILGRIVEGFSRSMVAAALTVLIDELADPKFRGFTLSSVLTIVSVGIMLIASLGALLDWRSASGVAAAVSLASIVPLFFLPESPSWLVRKDHIPEAQRSLRWLWGRGQELQAQEELEMLTIRFASPKEERQTGGFFQNFLKIFREFFTPRILKSFFIIHFFNTIQVFCGLSIFTFYTIDILSKIRTTGKSESLNDNLSVVILSLVRVLSNTLTTFLMLRIGRRAIALVSGIGSSVSTLILGTILFLHTTENGSPVPVEMEAWVNFMLIIAFVAFNSFGFLMLPVLMIGETQAAHVRGFICGYIYTMNDLILGAVLKNYPLLLQLFQIHGLFLLFGFSCLICTIFVYIFLPETQGKTLEEIEDYFRQPNIMWITRKK